MRRAWAITIAVFTFGAASVHSSAQEEHQRGTHLPFQYIADIEVDSARQRVYLTGGPDSLEILVADYEGNLLLSLPGISSPHGLEIVDNILYVAETDASQIARFNLLTTPPSPLLPLSTAPTNNPRDLVFLGGRLWFSGGTCGGIEGEIASIDLAGLTYRSIPNPDTLGWRCPIVDGGTNAPARLFTYETIVGPPTLIEYDVTTDPATLVQRKPEFGGDVEPLPGGDEFLMGYQDKIGVFDIDDFSGPSRSYDALAEAVVVSDEGTIAGGVWMDQDDYSAVPVFRDGESPHATFDFEPIGGDEIDLRGLAITPDGARVFAVIRHYDNTSSLYAFYPNAQRTLTKVSVDQPVIAGKVINIHVSVSPPPTSGNVELFQFSDSSPPHVIASGDLDEDGNFSWGIQAFTKTFLLAEYDGTESFLPSESSRLTVPVLPSMDLRIKGQRDREDEVKTFRVGDKVKIRNRIYPTPSGKITFTIYRMIEKGWRKIDTKGVSIDLAGGSRTSIKARLGQFAVTASYAGDEWNAPRTTKLKRFNVVP